MHILRTFHFVDRGGFAEADSIGRGSLCFLESLLENSGRQFHFKIFVSEIFLAVNREEEVIVFRRPTQSHRFNLARPFV